MIVVVVEVAVEEGLDLIRGIESGQDDELAGGEPEPERGAAGFEQGLRFRADGIPEQPGERRDLLVRWQVNEAFFRDRLAHGGAQRVWYNTATAA